MDRRPCFATYVVTPLLHWASCRKSFRRPHVPRSDPNLDERGSDWLSCRLAQQIPSRSRSSQETPLSVYWSKPCHATAMPQPVFVLLFYGMRPKLISSLPNSTHGRF